MFSCFCGLHYAVLEQDEGVLNSTTSSKLCLCLIYSIAPHHMVLILVFHYRYKYLITAVAQSNGS